MGGKPILISAAVAALLAVAVPSVSAARTVRTEVSTASGVSQGSATSQPKNTCSSQQTAPGVNGRCILNDTYSGYSAQLPDGYWALGVTGTWVVPQISSCPANVLNDHPRTAVWVGEWGSWAHLRLRSQGGKEDAWLPQIGTVSRCSNGNAIYSVGWEMASDKAGYGNSAQLSMDCPGDRFYKLCSYTDYPNNPSNSMTISPGDQILASVGIITTRKHPQSRGGRHVRKFQIYLDDETTGVIAVGHLKTAKGDSRTAKVRRAAIIKQGGVIVENEPSCSIADFLILSCKNGDTFNGLAEFGTPIPITAYIAQWKQRRATVNEYVMQRGYFFNLIHHQLAQNSQPSGSMTGPNGMSWTVSWLRQY
jgi:hypothetical protein